MGGRRIPVVGAMPRTARDPGRTVPRASHSRPGRPSMATAAPVPSLPRDVRSGVLFAVAAGVCLGVTVPFAKRAFAPMPPLFAAAGCTSAGRSRSSRSLLARPPVGARRIDRSDLRWILGAAAFGCVAAPLCLCPRALRCSPPTSSRCWSTSRRCSACSSAILCFRERLGWRRTAGVALLIVASVLTAALSTRGGDAAAGGASLAGVLWIAGACLAWAFDTNLLSPASHRDARAIVVVHNLAGGAAAFALHAAVGVVSCLRSRAGRWRPAPPSASSATASRSGSSCARSRSWVPREPTRSSSSRARWWRSRRARSSGARRSRPGSSARSRSSWPAFGCSPRTGPRPVTNGAPPALPRRVGTSRPPRGRRPEPAMPKPFVNEPFTNFADPANQHAFLDALTRVEEELGAHHPNVIDGERIRGAGTPISTHNPSDPAEVIGMFPESRCRRGPTRRRGGVRRVPGVGRDAVGRPRAPALRGRRPHAARQALLQRVDGEGGRQDVGRGRRRHGRGDRLPRVLRARGAALRQADPGRPDRGPATSCTTCRSAWA